MLPARYTRVVKQGSCAQLCERWSVPCMRPEQATRLLYRPVSERWPIRASSRTRYGRLTQIGPRLVVRDWPFLLKDRSFAFFWYIPHHMFDTRILVISKSVDAYQVHGFDPTLARLASTSDALHISLACLLTAKFLLSCLSDSLGHFFRIRLWSIALWGH